jgi:hypothetical protein
VRLDFVFLVFEIVDRQELTSSLHRLVESITGVVSMKAITAEVKHQKLKTL